MMIGIENHLLDPLYTIPITVWRYMTIWAHFEQNVSELAFCLSKEKIELFFQKSKIDLYMVQIDPALSEMKNLDQKHISSNLSW